jgi:hypothetical protein
VSLRYFVCSGRHEKRNACAQPAVSIALIENKVVDLYETVQIGRELRSEVERHLRGALETSSEETRMRQRDLLLEQGRLQSRSKKMLDGHLDGAVPAALYQ